MIISNNLIGKMPIPDDAIIRINLAWFKTKEEAEKVIIGCKSVYLDYPDGRSKPPRPSISLVEAIELSKLDNVSYFAISNVEDVLKIKELQEQVGKPIVPKIETKKGVEIIEELIEIGIDMIMLDKEDLYTNVDCDSFLYTLLIDKVRTYGSKIKILELQGVVFI